VTAVTRYQSRDSAGHGPGVMTCDVTDDARSLVTG